MYILIKQDNLTHRINIKCHNLRLLGIEQSCVFHISSENLRVWTNPTNKLDFFLHLRSLSIFWDYKTQPIFSGIIQLHLTKSSLTEILIPLCQPFLANTLSIMQKAPELRPKVLFKIYLLRLFITKKNWKGFLCLYIL